MGRALMSLLPHNLPPPQAGAAQSRARELEQPAAPQLPAKPAPALR